MAMGVRGFYWLRFWLLLVRDGLGLVWDWFGIGLGVEKRSMWHLVGRYFWSGLGDKNVLGLGLRWEILWELRNVLGLASRWESLLDLLSELRNVLGLASRWESHGELL